MNQQNVDMFILSKGHYFPSSALLLIRERLNKLDDSYLSNLLSAKFKNPTMGFFFSIGLGVYGVDRFYVGHIFVGILKLILTLVFFVTYFFVLFKDYPNPIFVGLLIILGLGVLIWYIVDIFNISNAIKEYNYSYLITLLN